MSQARAAWRSGRRWLHRLGRRARSGSPASRLELDYRAALAPLARGEVARFNLTIDFELGLRRIQAGDSQPRIVELRREQGLYAALLGLSRECEVPITWAIPGRLLTDEATARGECHAMQLLEALAEHGDGHEVGCHSFDHPMYSRPDFGRADAERDLALAADAFAAAGLSPSSFIFPKNQAAHADLLVPHGFRIYRGARGTALRRDAWGTWVIPFGLWLGPRALRPADLVALIEAGVRAGAFIHYWCHLSELVDGDELRSFLGPALRMVRSMTADGSLTPSTLAEAAELFDQLDTAGRLTRTTVSAEGQARATWG